MIASGLVQIAEDKCAMSRAAQRLGAGVVGGAGIAGGTVRCAVVVVGPLLARLVPLLP
jgi:hypothetical protein